MRSVLLALIYLRLSACICGPSAFAADDKPTVAVFPIGGDADAVQREKVAFALRAKLDRGGVYVPIDGPRMIELTGDTPIAADAKPGDLAKLAEEEKPDVLIWGTLSGKTLVLHVADLRTQDVQVQTTTKTLAASTDLRFATEETLELLAGVGKAGHMTEESVSHDEESERLWKTNPNLGGEKESAFDEAGGWRALLGTEKNAPPVSADAPAEDKVVLNKEGDNSFLAMRLSRGVAEGPGLACLGPKIEIGPDRRYRISFRYQSDGPTIHPFIKGYFVHTLPDGTTEEREIYRRQVPTAGDTHGEWVTIIDELNPQHTTFPVQFLRVDFYAYLSPGTVKFDDVVIKEVGKQNRKAEDAALDKPATRPGE